MQATTFIPARIPYTLFTGFDHSQTKQQRLKAALRFKFCASANDVAVARLLATQANYC